MTQEKQPPPLSPQEQIVGMGVLNALIARAIQVAALYGVADHLQDGPKSAVELAKLTQTHPDALYRLLRALATVGVFEESNTDAPKNGEHHFALTPLSQCLCQNVPGSMYAMVRQFGLNLELKSWNELEYSVRTGKPAVDYVFKINCWEYLQGHPDEAAIFNQSMGALTQMTNPAILQAYDFSGMQSLMDIGGGNGMFIRAILQEYPHMHGILFDSAQAVEGVDTLNGRCEVLTGDLFKSLPKGQVDACVLKHVLHDWDDQSCLTILLNTRRALIPGKKLLIVEQVLPESDPAPFEAFVDLEFLVTGIGRGRTTREYQALLEQIGFTLTRVVQTASSDSIIEAVAVEIS